MLGRRVEARPPAGMERAERCSQMCGVGGSSGGRQVWGRKLARRLCG